MPPEEPTALEILYRRYARGEIDTAAFTQMRERLEEAQEKQERESVAAHLLRHAPLAQIAARATALLSICPQPGCRLLK